MDPCALWGVCNSLPPTKSRFLNGIAKKTDDQIGVKFGQKLVYYILSLDQQLEHQPRGDFEVIIKIGKGMKLA